MRLPDPLLAVSVVEANRKSAIVVSLGDLPGIVPGPAGDLGLDLVTDAQRERVAFLVALFAIGVNCLAARAPTAASAPVPAAAVAGADVELFDFALLITVEKGYVVRPVTINTGDLSWVVLCPAGNLGLNSVTNAKRRRRRRRRRR